MIRILLSTKLGEMKWSQADLARATGIRPNTISELYHEYTDRSEFGTPRPNMRGSTLRTR
ncbi:MAG: helix-turn-helix domain-containing protein [Coprococcus sp.]